MCLLLYLSHAVPVTEPNQVHVHLTTIQLTLGQVTCTFVFLQSLWTSGLLSLMYQLTCTGQNFTVKLIFKQTKTPGCLVIYTTHRPTSRQRSAYVTDKSRYSSSNCKHARTHTHAHRPDLKENMFLTSR